MTLEDFADSFSLTELSYDTTVVEVEMSKDTATRKFYVPVHGANGFHAMAAACGFLVEVAEQEYLIEKGEEYTDVDSDFTILLYDDYQGTEVEVYSEGLFMSEFIGDLINAVRIVEREQYYVG